MNDNKLLVGYGRADITPAESVPLGGYGNTSKRMSQSVRDPLYATCVAFTDSQGSTALLFTTDNVRAKDDLTEQLRGLITAEMGIPRECVMVAATHTHSGPDMYNDDIPSIHAYWELYIKQMMEAARQAMADRKEATILAGDTRTERMNFVRHYKMADGTYAGSNFGRFKDNVIVEHTSPSDPQLMVVKFAREGGEDILLMNWQAHPCLTGGMGATEVSADYIGEVRKYLETKTGVRFAFFQGAAGNQNVRSRIEGEHLTADPVEYGQLLGEAALRALETAKPMAGGKVQGMLKKHTCQFDHSDDHMLDAAWEVRNYWMETYDRPGAMKMAQERGMNSPYAANGVIKRSRQGTQEDMEVGALRIGDLGFACAPYEMFAVNGVYIKENSPFDTTFVVTCCNGTYNYLASEFAFSHGCYEVDTRRFLKGTAEDLASLMVDMLGQLKQ